MKVFLIVVFSLWGGVLWAQKKAIDSIAYKIWPSLDYPILSSNGNYVCYNILNVPVGSKTLVLQKTDGTWKKEFIGGLVYARFSEDSKQFLFSRGIDSTGVFTLGNNNLQYVANEDLNIETRRTRWRISFSKNETGKLILTDSKTSKESYFLNVVQTRMLTKNEKLVVCTVEDSKMESLLWVDLGSGRVSKLWQGTEFKGLIIDEAHAQLAFMSSDSVWFYKFDAPGAISVAGRNSDGSQNGALLTNIDRFSKDGERLFLRFQNEQKTDSIKPLVEVWSYADVKLKSQSSSNNIQMDYLSVLDIRSGHINRLQFDNDQLIFPRGKNASDTLVLVQHSMNSTESWNLASKVSWSLVSTRKATKQSLDFLDDKRIVIFSPSGKYLIYTADQNRGYCSYQIKNRTTSDLTKGLKIIWADLYRDDLYANKQTTYPRGILNLVWLKNDNGFLAFDRHDIWKLDPTDRQKPINLTNGYGKQHQIIFSFAGGDYQENGINNNDHVYLSAFNNSTKDNGFYLISLIKSTDPTKLFMGPYVFNTKSGSYIPEGSDFDPIKAQTNNIYIVRRMTAQEAPNYFSTRDFKSFIRLSDLQPQKNFNWYTAQIHHWKSSDGRILNGILYKPENFDPNKKYPVIFYYYERKTNALNAYIKPEPLCSGCSIDIPTYVSKGYLVFSPDVFYEIGNPMQGTYDAIVSGAKYLSSLPYVNADRMGIQGCSFGGLQTNYLVTHTDIFKAAVSSSGIADLVSHYGSLDGSDSSSLQSYYEEGGQGRMGVSLWEKPEAYIRNSPVFRVDKVVTPILLMHTRGDDIYPFSNIVEFFTGLRRMGKKAWMLVYSKGKHVVYGREAEDFSIKMAQFFDYYLKDADEPVWMKSNDSIYMWNKNLLRRKEQFKVDSLVKCKSPTLNFR